MVIPQGISVYDLNNLEPYFAPASERR